MKIDWKHLATTSGYKRLKEALITDIQEAEQYKKRTGRYFRSPAEYYQHFNFAICRAKHYAHRDNRELHEVLTEWEDMRSYSWINYYQRSNFRKISGATQPKTMGTRGTIAYYKKHHKAKSRFLSKMVIKTLHDAAIKKRKKLIKKPRWSSLYKKAHRRNKSVS